MKSGFSSVWPSVVRLRLKDKSATPFCIFSKVKSGSNNPRSAPVYLNVYDLTTVNSYMYWAGLGIFHSAVEVYGIEYAFGAHDYPTTGVFEVEPRQCPGFKFRKSIFMGTTTLDPLQMRDFIERQSANYNGDTYHLIAKNCNHFCEDICFKLTGSSIPKWVNRLARIVLPECIRNRIKKGAFNAWFHSLLEALLLRFDYFMPWTNSPSCLTSLACSMLSLFIVLCGDNTTYSSSLCNCIMPDTLKTSNAEHDPSFEEHDNEKRRLRSAFSCLSSISMSQREISMSSLFLHSHYKGCLPPWELKRSKKGSLKQK